MSPGSEAPKWPRWLTAAGLVAGVLLAYWNSLNAPFLFDDTGAVLNNPTIRHLVSWAVLNPPADGTTTTGRPVINFSFAVNYALGGESPWGYRAVNVALHALTSLLLLGIVHRTLAGPILRERFGAVAWPLACLTALLWALHPLQTESVTCIAQRTESLCGFFYLLTLYCFVRGADQVEQVSDPPMRQAGQVRDLPNWSRPHRTWLGLSVFFCLLGMGTKEVMVTAPVLVLLYDRTFVSGSFSAAWRRHRAWHCALAGTWLLLGWLLVRGGGGRGASAGFGFGISWWQYLLQQCDAILLYLKLSVWPHPLVLDYGTTVVHTVREVWWQGICVVTLLVVTAWALVRRPLVGFLGAWFFVILAPSSSIVPLVGQTMAEHRMYLPLAGVVTLILAGLYHWINPRTVTTFAVAAALVAVGLGVMTAARNRDYLDVLQIWTDTVAKYPQNARAHNNLGGVLQKAGRYAEANAQFARAIELQPGYVTAHYTWGVALLDQKRMEAAITEFKFVVALAPNHADAWVNLGNALMQVQRTAEAAVAYQQALQLTPTADAHYDLGVALADLGRNAEALEHLRTALRLAPDLTEAYYQLARAEEQSGQLAAAERDYSETLRRMPDHARAHGKLGLILARSNRMAQAVEHFQAVIRLAPGDADAQANLGNAFLLQGRVREAVAAYEAALRLRPDDAGIRENLQIAREALR